MDLIIYHKDCPDGFCAALIAKKRYPEAALLALSHGLSESHVAGIISSCTNLDVLMVDFSFPTRDSNVALNTHAKSFRIFDHHKTAQAELDGLDFTVFDVNRSGAGITWDELFGRYDRKFHHNREGREIDLGDGRVYIGMPEPLRPWYVDYVQDHDLWKHELPSSREVNAYIMTLPFTEGAWRDMMYLGPKEAMRLGTGALAYINHYVREVVKQRQMAHLNGPSIAIVNAPYLNCSEIGAELATEYADIGLTWFERGDGQVQFSLRSKNGSDIDVSAIAKMYGGGGHKHAAGFQMTLAQSRLLIDDILHRGAK